MLESFLRTQDSHWPALVRALAPDIHEVDRAAVRVWFSLHPLILHDLAERHGGDPHFHHHFVLRGRYRLADRIDSSHRFLYGHNRWPDVKKAILAHDAGPADLAALCHALAPAPRDLTLGLTAIGLMTLRQAGRDAFAATLPAARPPARTPEQVLDARRQETGFFARLTRKPPRIVFNENDPEGWFPLIPSQEITNAAELDKRPHHLKDDRCFENMGPIPVECRSGKCGTCWIGILAGHENLAPVSDWERKRLAWFGYFDSGFESLDQPQPSIRLACQATATGPVTIVIPPWCGIIGQRRRDAWKPASIE